MSANIAVSENTHNIYVYYKFIYLIYRCKVLLFSSSDRPVICQDMPFPLAPLASRHLPGVGGRAQTASPSGLSGKVPPHSRNLRDQYCVPSLVRNPSLNALYSLYGISFLAIFKFSSKGRKNFPFQRQHFQRVVTGVKKTSKKDYQKAWISGKRGYFCTRNKGEVHKQDWKNAG